MTFSDVGYKVLWILIPIVLSLIGLASTKLSAYLSAKASTEYLYAVMSRLNDAVWTAVQSLNQTVVDDLKAAQNGALTDAQKTQLKNDALTNVKSYLGAKGLDILAHVLGLDDSTLANLILNKIESAVGALKSSGTAVAVSAAPVVAPAAVAPVAPLAS